MHSDQDAAIKLLKKFKRVNPLCDKCIEGLVIEKDKNLSPGQSAALVLYIRWLKTPHSHLRNIITSVVNLFEESDLNQN
jgi:hypothetical protein